MKTTLEQAERWELVALEKRECLLAERERHLANAAAYRQEAEGKKRAARWLEREETPRHLRDPALARDLWKDYRDLHRLVDWSEKRAEELRREASNQREYAEEYRALAVTIRADGCTKRGFVVKVIRGKVESFDESSSWGQVRVGENVLPFHSACYSSRPARFPTPGQDVEVVFSEASNNLVRVRELDE